MKLFEFPVVATDALTGGTAMVDITTLQDMVVTATTFAMSGNGWTITMTFDGTNAAEKLLNAQKIAASISDKSYTVRVITQLKNLKKSIKSEKISIKIPKNP